MVRYRKMRIWDLEPRFVPAEQVVVVVDQWAEVRRLFETKRHCFEGGAMQEPLAHYLRLIVDSMVESFLVEFSILHCSWCWSCCCQRLGSHIGVRCFS